ncbi:UPF0136 membrane protein [Auxenochlorella protothecoides]|nr:UPF0136 membrane protein [Auxenochlorella protothecoides]KFM28095.1 UPF0136 membrane protein [Auxenochlorella protothecoides]
MAFVTGVGGLSAYFSKRSIPGLVTGLGLGAVFAVGGYWVTTNQPEKHQAAHQMSLISSVLFAGAMGYRASANPYAGPGGNMLAALGIISSAYHLTKMLEWQAYEQQRIEAASRLLAQYQTGTVPHQDGEAGPIMPPRRPAPPGGF